jgi:hypothetical protein
MAEERVPCRTEGCGNTIQPATVKRNNGYCGPCFNRIALQAHEQYIRENRRDVDLYAGVTDPVEILTIYHQPRDPDSLVNYLPCPRSVDSYYAALTDQQAARLLEFALHERSMGNRYAGHAVSCCLAAFTDHCLEPLINGLIGPQRYEPPIMYRNAGDEIATQIIEVLPTDSLTLDHALCCLAWIGTDMVAAFFAQADRTRPAWTELLNIEPGQYAQEAGWEVRHGARHNLYFERCFALTLASEDEEGDDAIAAMQATSDRCPWCGRNIVDMLRVDAEDDRFTFLRACEPQLCIPTCTVCTCYTDFGLCFRQGIDGTRQWVHTGQVPEVGGFPDADDECNPWTNKPIRLTQRHSRHAADQFLPTTFSQIGGLPSWIHDFHYPSCCECGQSMMFVAQLDNEDAGYSEGVYYGFLCPDCQITTTHHQHT